jgi:hypothetical protein
VLRRSVLVLLRLGLGALVPISRLEPRGSRPSVSWAGQQPGVLALQGQQLAVLALQGQQLAVLALQGQLLAVLAQVLGGLVLKREDLVLQGELADLEADLEAGLGLLHLPASPLARVDLAWEGDSVALVSPQWR